MGKVGSSSIYYPLWNIHNKPVVHIHTFNPNNDIHIKGLRKVYQTFKAKALLQLIKNKKIKLISLTREPIGRNISNFFYVLDMFINPYSINKKDLLNDFLKLNPHKRALNWFDQELKHFFGIDIYNYKFDKEKGYLLINKDDNVELLMLRMENMNSLAKVIGEFVNIPNFELVRTNEGNENWYKELYKYFKENFDIPKEYVESMYNSKYTKHFYSEKELDTYRKKWNKNTKQVSL